MTLADADLIRCPLFHEMTAEERRQVVGLAETNVYPAGASVLEEGKSRQLLCVILRGRCQVVKNGRPAGEQELAVLEPGSVFGEMSFFNPAPHSATVRAISDVEILQIPRELFVSLEATGARAAYQLVLNALKVVSDRLRRIDEWTGSHINGHSTSKHQAEWREFRKRLYSGWEF